MAHRAVSGGGPVISVALKELRFNAGLSPEQLGQKTDVSGHTIRRLEAGAKPTPAIAKKLADFFAVKPSDIWPVGEEDES